MSQESLERHEMEWEGLPRFEARSILAEDDGDMRDLEALSLLALASAHPGTQLLPTTYCLYRQSVDVTGVHAMQILSSWPADPFGDARVLLDRWKASV